MGQCCWDNAQFLVSTTIADLAGRIAEFVDIDGVARAERVGVIVDGDRSS